MEQEVWCEIDGFPNYLISSWGNLWSLKFDKAIIGHPNRRTGTRQFLLTSSSQSRTAFAHTLVAEAFLGLDRKAGYYRIIHKDGNKLNDHYQNLEVKHQGE